MDNPLEQADSVAQRRSLLGAWPWFGVLLILVLVSFIRFRLLDIPLERDEGEYAYAGQLLMQGVPPYQLAYNMKLPGTYFAYALGMALFGQNIAGIHATLMVANSLTIIFVFLLARKLFGSAAGLAACATFGALSVSPAVLGFAVHANHFVILFAVPATLLLWKAEESNQRHTLCLSGLLYGFAFLMKQQAICYCLFAVAVIFWTALHNGTFLKAEFFKKLLMIGAAMLFPFLLICFYMACAGVFPKFWFWTFSYAGAYAGEMKWSSGMAKLWNYGRKTWVIYALFLGWVAVSLPFLARSRALRPQVLFAVAFLCFSFLGTAIDLNFREHYFILSLPALAIMVGLGLVCFQDAVGNPFLKRLPAFLCLLILACSIYQQRAFFFQYSSDTFCRIVYAEDTPFADMPQLAEYIRKNSAPNDTVAVVGSEPEVYFYSQRHSATGYIYTYGLMEIQPYAAQMQREMIREIEVHKPEYLVFAGVPASWNVRPGSDLEILKWFGRYSSAYYDQVAILVKSSWEQTDFLQGDEATKAQVNGADYVAVFRRKPSGH